MVVSIRVIGSKIRCLDRASLNGTLGKAMRANTTKIKNMGMEK